MSFTHYVQFYYKLFTNSLTVFENVHTEQNGFCSCSPGRYSNHKDTMEEPKDYKIS